MHPLKRLSIDLAWRAYERAPASADALFHLGRRYAMPLLRYAVPLARVRGRAVADGEPGSMLLADPGPQLLYLQRRSTCSAASSRARPAPRASAPARSTRCPGPSSRSAAATT